MCTDIFGPKFDIDLINKGVEDTNTYYGGLDIEVLQIDKLVDRQTDRLIDKFKDKFLDSNLSSTTKELGEPAVFFFKNFK